MSTTTTEHPAVTSTDYSPERLRDFQQRRSLASERHRAAMARMLGLSEKEAAAILLLARSGHLTPGQLGSLLSLTSGGVTALTQRLERAGHIRRQPHPADGRSTVLSAAPGIIERARSCMAPLVSDLDAVATRLSANEREAIGRFLEEVAAVSERHAARLAEWARQAEREQASVAPDPGLWA
jgi:DNA-binding MarR family transcriptional regulator